MEKINIRLGYLKRAIKETEKFGRKLPEECSIYGIKEAYIDMSETPMYLCLITKNGTRYYTNGRTNEWVNEPAKLPSIKRGKSQTR